MISLHKEKGMALFIAMLILPLLLVLGGLAMNSSLLGLKMVDARVLLGESNILLTNSSIEILNRSNDTLSFANATTNTTDTPDFTYGDVEAYIEVDDEGSTCKRSYDASAIDFECKYLQVNFIHAFGREKENGTKWAENGMSVGIEQQVLAD